MRNRILLHIWAVLFVLSMAMFTAGMTVNAASPNAVKTVTVRAEKKNITKKTYTLEIGKSDCKEKGDCKNSDYSYREKQYEKINLDKGKSRGACHKISFCSY